MAVPVHPTQNHGRYSGSDPSTNPQSQQYRQPFLPGPWMSTDAQGGMGVVHQHANGVMQPPANVDPTNVSGSMHSSFPSPSSSEVFSNSDSMNSIASSLDNLRLDPGDDVNFDWDHTLGGTPVAAGASSAPATSQQRQSQSQLEQQLRPPRLMFAPPGHTMGNPTFGVDPMNASMNPSINPMNVPGGVNSSLLNPTDMFFNYDFMDSVASSLDDLDTTTMFGPGDINFERDFGQWFSPDPDVIAGSGLPVDTESMFRPGDIQF